MVVDSFWNTKQAGLSGVISALNLKMRLHIVKRTGVAAFPKSGSGYALALGLLRCCFYLLISCGLESRVLGLRVYTSWTDLLI